MRQNRLRKPHAIPAYYNYLGEVQYRFDRRGDLAAMVPRLAVATAQTKPWPKRRVTGKG
jgi:hypothetical protein